MSSVLLVDDVAKSYGGHPALLGVDLAVEAGQIVGLLGPNGAGKTTLVAIAAGLRRADSGRVEICGIDIARHPDRARALLGLAPQDLGIYPPLSVRDNLRLFAELAGFRKAALTKRIDEVAAALGLTELLGRTAATMSGGEKRRLHTAMALLNRPQLLLLDEPTTGADVASRARLLHAVRDLAADGAAVVYSTHYLPEVEELGATVVLLEAGTVIARGTVPELVARHGGSSLELAFDGPAPEVDHPDAARPEPNILRIPTDDPARVAASVLVSLGPDASRLRSIEIVRPSLEAVYLTLTGRRYAADQEAPEEAAVHAS